MISDPTRRGFTLLEILLVVLVIGITAAAFLPVALNTADQARTRSVLRQVISLNRYARSRAILDHTPVAVEYDPAAGTLRMLQLRPPPPDRDPELTEPEDPVTSETPVDSLTVRHLPDTMRLAEINGVPEDDEGRVRVVYSADGVSAPHEVELVDPRGQSRRIRFNGFTGEATLEP